MSTKLMISVAFLLISIVISVSTQSTSSTESTASTASTSSTASTETTSSTASTASTSSTASTASTSSTASTASTSSTAPTAPTATTTQEPSNYCTQLNARDKTRYAAPWTSNCIWYAYCFYRSGTLTGSYYKCPGTTLFNNQTGYCQASYTCPSGQ
ncbi:cell wall protein DAN4 isoform X3 [Contarinia nasturtii]|uniref:cell wall protein DAN4 isoform X3 n=1 Tax=Contarinia nasturtii TaxID=265458 RepID=UPI0012D3CBBF|nr:cell wall protein DAN4 isoform X3 [Contarinia nasturtii]